MYISIHICKLYRSITLSIIRKPIISDMRTGAFVRLLVAADRICKTQIYAKIYHYYRIKPTEHVRQKTSRINRQIIDILRDTPYNRKILTISPDFLE